MSNQVIRSQVVFGNTNFAFGLSGLPTVSVNVEGTISAGNYTPQVSDDDQNWYDVTVYNPAGDAVTAITVASLYRADVNGYELFRLHPSGDFSGAPALQYFGYPTPMISLLSEAPLNNDLLALAWQAGTYAANSLVLHNGSFWIANASTSAEPGVSGWTSYATLGAALTYILGLFNQA